MTKAANAVEQAVEMLGGPTKASHVALVSAGSIHYWCKQGRVYDGAAAVRLADATGIDVRALVGLDEPATHPPQRPRKRHRRTGVDFQKQSGVRGGLAGAVEAVEAGDAPQAAPGAVEVA